MKQFEESAKAEPWAALSLSQSEPASAELTYLLSSEPIAPVSSEPAYPTNKETDTETSKSGSV